MMMMKKNTRSLYFILLCFTICFSQSCRSGVVFVQKQEKHVQEAQKIEKIVSIDPDIVLMDESQELEDFVLGLEEKENKYRNSLVKNARLNGIKLEVFSSSESADYYNYLLPLKNQVLFALSTQEIEMSSRKNKGMKYKTAVDNSYFSESLEFDSGFGVLEEIYGTPYFSITGIISVKKKKWRKWVLLALFPPGGINGFVRNTGETLYYNVLVDVRRGEIVHRELRSFRDPLSGPVMESMLYDSFRLINRKNDKN